MFPILAFFAFSLGQSPVYMTDIEAWENMGIFVYL